MRARFVVPADFVEMGRRDFGGYGDRSTVRQHGSTFVYGLRYNGPLHHLWSLRHRYWERFKRYYMRELH